MSRVGPIMRERRIFSIYFLGWLNLIKIISEEKQMILNGISPVRPFVFAS
jgi:hypothetical protein